MKKFYYLFLALSITISAYATTKVVKHKIKKGETLYTIAQKYHTSIDEIRKKNKIKKEDILHLGKILTVPTNTYFSGLVGHIIDEEDTLTSIAKKYNSTIDDILKANAMTINEELDEGDILKVPENTYYPTQTIQIVKKIEKKIIKKPTIIVKKDIPKKKIVKKEIIKKKELIKKKIVKKNIIKERPKTKKIKIVKYRKYKIRRGDMVSTVAKRYKISEKKLRRANNLKKGAILKLGKYLQIPYIQTKTVLVDSSTKNVRKKSNKFKKYIIKKGDTLFTIARKHHTTTKEIREVNRLKKGAILKLGRELKVPVNTYFSGLAGYLIQRGDTLFTIARAHKTTVVEVREANNLEKGATLALGQLLKVPQNTYNPNQATQPNRRVVIAPIVVVVKKKEKKKSIKLVKYIIERGDTLSTISRKFSISVKKLRELNKLKRGSTLRLGRNLKLPYSKKSARKIRLAKIKKRRNSSKSRIVVAINNNSSKVKVSNRNKRYKIKRNLGDIFFSNINRSSSSKSNNIISLAKKKLGRRYVWGATGKKNTFDCSGLTTYVYKKNGINLPRRAIAQSKVGTKISRGNLKKGDLIFFDTSHRIKGYVNHVGIYIGNNKFIHASSAKKKVVITSLNKPFYSQRFRGGRRL
ncbi:MAG: LysM peptidoglycan-binding domain-containing protein [Sulfurovum sp.]